MITGALRIFYLFLLIHRNGTKLGRGFGTCYVTTHKKRESMGMI